MLFWYFTYLFLKRWNILALCYLSLLLFCKSYSFLIRFKVLIYSRLIWVQYFGYQYSNSSWSCRVSTKHIYKRRSMYFQGVLSAFDNETLSCKFSKRRQIIFRTITVHWTPVNEGSNEITLASLVFLCFCMMVLIFWENSFLHKMIKNQGFLSSF